MKRQFAKLTKAEQQKAESEYQKMKPDEFDVEMSQAEPHSPDANHLSPRSIRRRETVENPMSLPANPTNAFWSMLESQGELRGYANLYIIEPDFEHQLQKSDHPAFSLREMWPRSSKVAARLGIVYLVAVMEAYLIDVVQELLVKRIKRINRGLLDQLPPKNEDDDIMNEIEIEEAELNREHPFYLFAEITKEYIQNQTRQDTLRNMIRLLEKHFGIHIHDRELHLNRWKELNDRRKQIVHHRASSRKKSMPIILKDETRTIDEILVEKGLLLKSLDEMHALALAVEMGINNHSPLVLDA